MMSEITVRQAAEIKGVSRMAIVKAIHRGEFPARQIDESIARSPWLIVNGNAFRGWEPHRRNQKNALQEV